MQKIALLGFGAMGSGIAKNWRKAGFPVTVYNRSQAKAREIEAGGMTHALTPKAAAANADVIFSIVSDDRASRDVWLGHDGALDAAARGSIFVEASTITPDWARELAAVADRRGLKFLDAPVGGTKDAAAEGRLMFFEGGKADALEAARPALTAVSSSITHLGAVGAGATWKLINNWMLAAQVAALAEALSFAELAGFDLQRVAALILSSSTASPIVKSRLPRILEKRFNDPDLCFP